MDRRLFLQFLAQAGLASLYPGYLLANSNSNQHVIFLQKDDRDYGTHALLFNKRLRFTPSYIAVCFSETGVIQALEFAYKHKLPVAIKSGGHSFDGFSMNNDGLVIDLIEMNQAKLTNANRFIAQPSHRLMQMYALLINKGRLVSSGSCGMLGISGVTLGGGYGLFSRNHGLCCDMLQRIRMVDANGQVHESSGESDLIWACRGGGNGSFGVITELEFETVAAPPKLAQYRFKSKKQNPKQIAGIIETWFGLAKDLPNDCFSAFVINRTSVLILVTSTVEKPGKQLSHILGQFEKMTQQRYKDRHQELDTAVRRYFGKLSPLNFKNASAGMFHSYEDIRNVAESVFDIVGRTNGMVFQVNTMGGNINNNDFIRRSCYPHRGHDFISEVQTYWENDKHATTAIDAVGRVQKILFDNGVRAHYANYPDINFKNWQHAYYGAENYNKLQAIKLKYDKHNVFRHPQSIRLPD